MSLFSRVGKLLHRGRVEREMDEEIAFHLHARTEALIAEGLAPAEAARRARVEFGGAATHKDGVRAAWGLRWWDELWADLRYGARVLNKSRGFTAVAAGSLALAIGANTAVFSAANRLIYAKLGVPHPEELRLFTLEGPNPLITNATWGTNSLENGMMSMNVFPYPVFREMQKRNRSLGGIVGFKGLYRPNVTANGLAQQASGQLVSGNYYSEMQIKPQLGRGLLPADEAVSDAGAVALISDGFWHRAFGGSAGVLGRSFNVNGNLVTIVGVNPRGFTGVQGAQDSPDITMPLTMVNQVSPIFGDKYNLLAKPDVWWVNLIARRKPGVPDATVAAEMNVLFTAAVRGSGIELKPDRHIPSVLIGDGSRGLHLFASFQAKPVNVLLAMTALVLVLACANIANLMLARASVREREMSVRLALGASRMRILRQIMTESLLISGMGGVFGLVLAFALRNQLTALLMPTRNLLEPIHVPFDWHVFGFAASATIVTGLLFGLLPAWRASRGEVHGGLKETGRTVTRRRGNWSGRGLIATQVMLSTLLVAGAALFTRTLVNLYRLDPGFKTAHLLQFDLSAPEQHYPARKGIDVHDRIKAELAAVPGVEAVTLANPALLAGSQNGSDVQVENHPKAAKGEDRDVWYTDTDSSFMSVMGVPILRGRNLGPQDTATAPRVVVVNQAFVKKFFPHEDPIGRRFTWVEEAKPVVWITIIGICGDTLYSEITQPVLPLYFGLYSQLSRFGGGTYTIRSPLPPKDLLPSLRRAVQRIDPDLPLTNIRTMDEQIADDLQQQRLFATLTAAFGLLALLLAVVGVYGVMAYTVAQRTHEIGIRLALGSPRGAVRWLVLRESLALGVAGVLAGLGAAWALGRSVESLLYGLKPRDPVSLGGAALVLLLAALLAGWVPALRASRVDPLTALRHE